MRRVPWLALGLLLAGAGIWMASWLRPVAEWLPGCGFKRLTGFACATCGLTRCVLALGAGDWRGAFHWHPVAALVAMAMPALAFWDLRRAWRDEAYPGLPDSRAARLSIWAVLIVTWVVQAVRGI